MAAFYGLMYLLGEDLGGGEPGQREVPGGGDEDTGTGRASASPQPDELFWEWMWADARLLPLPGMQKLAAKDPFLVRWSKPMNAEALAADLEAYAEKKRPVQCRIAARRTGGKVSLTQSGIIKFNGPTAAANWIRHAEVTSAEEVGQLLAGADLGPTSETEPLKQKNIR